ncbi:MAG: hypothetical protein ABLT11_04665 [Candidatus Acidiferrum sp.]
MLGYDIPSFSTSACVTRVLLSTVSNCTSRGRSRTGSAFSSVAFTTVKIVVFAPMPSASDNIATAVKPGFLRNIRKP